MTGDKDKLLNERNELITKYRHVDNFCLRITRVEEEREEREEVEDDDIFPVGI